MVKRQYYPVRYVYKVVVERAAIVVVCLLDRGYIFVKLKTSLGTMCQGKSKARSSDKAKTDKVNFLLSDFFFFRSVL